MTGVSIGSLIGGLMIEKLKGRATFRYFGIFALVMCVLYKGIMLTIDRRFQPVSQTGKNSYNSVITIIGVVQTKKSLQQWFFF